MGIDWRGFAFPKGSLLIEDRREKRIAKETAEQKCHREVDARDHRKCRVPGCKEPMAERHHLTPRSRSKAGIYDVANIVSLCVAHHRLAHAGRIKFARQPDGELVITGARADLRFKL